jgi:hypothetical protein
MIRKNIADLARLESTPGIIFGLVASAWELSLSLFMLAVIAVATVQIIELNKKSIP